MKIPIFSYLDYKEFLRIWIESSDEPRGLRARLARAAGCHTAYVTLILNKSSDLSLEQAEKIGRYIGLNEEEIHYFFLLIEYSRAGSQELKSILRSRIQKIQATQKDLKNRLKSERGVSGSAVAEYYSSWLYTAIHSAFCLSNSNTVESVSERFKITQQTTRRILNFLIEEGLLKKNGSSFQPGSVQLHLEKSSPLISKHHFNWRIQAVQSLTEPDFNDLHYSSVITINKKNAPQVEEILTQAVESIRKVVKDSTAEDEVYCYLVDFFRA